MHKNAMKYNKTQSKWCINKHGASKIIDTFETYQPSRWWWVWCRAHRGEAFRAVAARRRPCWCGCRGGGGSRQRDGAVLREVAMLLEHGIDVPCLPVCQTTDEIEPDVVGAKELAHLHLLLGLEDRQPDGAHRHPL
jgi:hypothetical protein